MDDAPPPDERVPPMIPDRQGEPTDLTPGRLRLPPPEDIIAGSPKENEVESTPSTDTTTIAATTQTPVTRIATTISQTTSTSSEDESTSTAETSTETISSEPTASSTEESTSTTLPLTSSESRIETSTESSTTKTTRTETSTSIEETSKSSETRPSSKTSPVSLPSKVSSKADTKDDGLGTGTTIGIVLAAFVGIGVLLVIIGALLKWNRKRLIAKKSAGLPEFKTILDFADASNGSRSIDLANQKAAEEMSSVPVTPPYRPEVRQAPKRNSWYDAQRLPEDPSAEDYTFQPADLPRARRGPSPPHANSGQYGYEDRRAQTMDDSLVDHGMPGYGTQPAYGGMRPPPQLVPGFHAQQSTRAGGSFDPVRSQTGYGPYAGIEEQDDMGDSRNGPPVRNRHFPAVPGRAYTSDNPYPFVPRGQL